LPDKIRALYFCAQKCFSREARASWIVEEALQDAAKGREKRRSTHGINFDELVPRRHIHENCTNKNKMISQTCALPGYLCSE
jgi:hypothetical protein